MKIFGSFLGAEGLRALENYEYQSGAPTNLDRFLDKFWWSKSALYVPDNVAPNTLTLFGWFCTLISVVLVIVYCPTFTELIPRSIALLIAVLLFVFQTLDAIDGKHARRLGISSPLGQLFDHGCDSFSAIWFAWITGAITGFGLGPVTYSLIVIFQYQMFVYIWWEIHAGYFKSNTGGLAGFATGVTEGQVVVIALCFSAWAFGPEFYRTEAVDFFPVTIVNALALFGLQTYSISFLIWLPFFFNISHMIISDIRGCMKLIPKEKKREAMSQLLGLLFHIAVQAVFYSLGNKGQPLLICYLMTTYSSIIAIRMHLCAVCKIKFYAFQWPVIPFYVGTILLYIATENATSFADVVVLVMTLWATIYLFDLITTTMNDICSHLNVLAFTVVPLKASTHQNLGKKER